MQDINAKNQALESENTSLKDVIEQLAAEKQALEQTVTEVLKANIALKAGCSRLEKRIGLLSIEIAKKDEQIKELTPKSEPIEEPILE